MHCLVIRLHNFFKCYQYVVQYIQHNCVTLVECNYEGIAKLGAVIILAFHVLCFNQQYILKRWKLNVISCAHICITDI